MISTLFCINARNIIYNLKHSIKKKWHILVEQQNIIYERIILQYCTLLKGSGIIKNSSIIVNFRLCGGALGSSQEIDRFNTWTQPREILSFLPIIQKITLVLTFRIILSPTLMNKWRIMMPRM